MRLIASAKRPTFSVKLLFDENLSSRLVQLLKEEFPGSAHVHKLNLGASEDGKIWQQARADDYVIVTKDSDFVDMSLVFGYPPKVIQLCVGNISTLETKNLLTRMFHKPCETSALRAAVAGLAPT